MTDEEVAAGVHAVPELFNQALLLSFVEINHDVAAKDDVVATGQEFGLEVVKVELDQLFQLTLDGVLFAGLFKIAKAAGVVHRLHLLLGVETFLADAKTGVADVGSDDFNFPGRRNERFRRRHVERKRIAQVVVSERVANQNGNGVRLLAGGATGAPDAEGVIAALLFVTKQIFENGLLEQFELRLVAKETGFVDGEVLEQERKLGPSFPAG